MGFIDRNLNKIKTAAVVLPPAAAVAVILYIKFLYIPGHGVECFTYKYLGIYCMGCGTTRQLYFALRGDFAKAFSYNVACLLSYPAFAYFYYLMLRWAIKDKKIKINEAYILATAAVALTIYMILRNIPIKIFDMLRPMG